MKKSRNDAITSLKMPVELREKLEQVAVRNDRTVSQLLREAARKVIDEYERKEQADERIAA